MHGSRCLHLLVADLVPFLLLPNAVFFEEELAPHFEDGVVTDLRPRTKSMPVDTYEEHSVFLGAPLAAIISGLGSLGQSECSPFAMCLDDLS